MTRRLLLGITGDTNKPTKDCRFEAVLVLSNLPTHNISLATISVHTHTRARAFAFYNTSFVKLTEACMIAESNESVGGILTITLNSAYGGVIRVDDAVHIDDGGNE